MQGAGSSLASSNIGLGTYTYAYATSANTPGYDAWSYKTTETLPDGNQNITYTNVAGEPLLQVYKDTTSGNTWETAYQYDSAGRINLVAQPSAVASYSESNPSLATLNTSSGLITTYGYYAATTAGETTAGGMTGDLYQTAVKQGSSGTSILQESTQYFLHTAGGVSVAPVATDTVYRNTNGTGGETTSYSYTWFTGTAQMQSEQVTLPSISSGENGPGTADVVTTYFNTLELPIWQKDGDGFLTYNAYDQATSALTAHIVDVDTTQTGEFTGLPSGWSTPTGGGLNLIDSYQVDGLGRDTKETDPAGNVNYTVYDDPDHEIRIYVGWNSTTHLPTGPTQVYRTDYAGSYTETLTMSATPHLTGGVPDGTEAISGLQTLSRTYTNIAGQVTRTDSYFNLSGVTWSTAASLGTLNTNYYEATQDYDWRGFLARQASANGTISRTVHDGLGRVTSIWVGTNDTPASGSWSPTNNTSPANMVETTSYQYDNGGVGDGNMTAETDYPGSSQANRVTDVWYDWRDRAVASKSGVQASENDGTHRPITFNTYNNLGEVTEVQRYDGDGVTITVTSGVPQAPSASLLRAQTVTAYDDQGRVYQTAVYEVKQSTGAVSTSALTTNTYYNHRGLEIAVSNPGGEVDKSQFDGAGRQTERYATDGASGTGWSAAGSVTGDNVLEQTDTQYDADGNAILVTTRLRNHNETTTGALGNETTAPKARVSYVAYYFDAADRPTATVDVGTNGGSAYTRPSTVPSSSATVLVTTQSYNSAGWVQDVVDPRGLDTRTSYDALGRTTQTIEDYTNGTPTNTSNKTTNFTYDGDGHMLSLQAVETGGASETTQWVYGVTSAGGSTLNSNDILATVEYPDPTTGAPSTSSEESYTADALGENLTYTDRAGNVHSYSYDVLGRLTADAITTLATGFDGSVRRIQTAYDALGNGYLVTSYNAASGGSIVNQVEDLYNGLDQLVQEYQAHSGAVVIGTTPSVQYAYTEMSGGQNNSRLVSMTYPNGRVLNYNYNTGLDSNISRLSSISDSSATLESYLYLGLDTVVERDHPQDGVNMTYISQAGGTGDAGDQYTGLDRFGRVVEVNWYKPSTSTSVDDFQYGYDPDGNVLYKNNVLHAAFSELYHANGASNGYDGLNQLSAFARGTLSDTNSDGIPDTVASASTSESWSLDALGNFSSVTLNGTPTSRTTNQQNEVTAVGASSLAFDANGNTTTDDQGHTLIYDAWNRLIQVKSGSSVLATYSYDGLGRRVTENTGTLRDMYFSSAWQVVEEDAAGVMKDQYVWSPVYVNALIERDTPTQRLYVQQDADWSVTSLVSSAGSPIERYLYDPYGGVTYLTGSWGSRSSSSYSWLYLFQGGRFTTATGLYSFQQRDYSPSLGRWVETDPSGFGGGDNNLYRTEGDAPADGTDPTGLFRSYASSAGRPLPPAPGSTFGPPPSGIKLFGQRWVMPWDPNAQGFSETVHAYGRALGVAGAGAAGGGAGGVVGGGASGAVGGGITGGPLGILPGAGAGAVVGGGWGIVAGLWGAAFCDTPEQAFSNGLQSGLVTGALAGLPVGGAAGAARAARGASEAAESAAAIEGEASASSNAPGKLVNCFPPDTLVATQTGLRRIGQIGAGERVWGYDFQTGIWRLCVVACRHDANFDGPLVTLQVDVGQVTATAYHPFWVIQGDDLANRPTPRHVGPDEDAGAALAGRWVNSHDLREGDVVFLKGHGPTTLRRVVQRDEQTPVCNLTVEELHTFAVGEMQALVHNTSGTSGPLPPRPGGTSAGGEMGRLQYDLSQMAEKGATPTEIQIALRERAAQLDALAQQQGWGRVVVEPYPNQVAGGWQVYQGRPILPGGNRPAIAIHGTTGQVVIGTTNDIRLLTSGEYGLFNFRTPPSPP